MKTLIFILLVFCLTGIWFSSTQAFDPTKLVVKGRGVCTLTLDNDQTVKVGCLLLTDGTTEYVAILDNKGVAIIAERREDGTLPIVWRRGEIEI